jgi:hypothetical protein
LKTPDAKEDTAHGHPAVAGKVLALLRAAMSKPEATSATAKAAQCGRSDSSRRSRKIPRRTTARLPTNPTLTCSGLADRRTRHDPSARRSH